MNAVCLFPGQGSQYVGMGKEFHQHFHEVRHIFELASYILQMDLSRLCFEGPESLLARTDNVQPAITVMNLACLHVAKEAGIIPVTVAGHSLGEYTALQSAGVLSLEDTIRLVHQRGLSMQEAADAHPGGMIAVIGLEFDQCREVCEKAEKVGVVDIANHNSRLQVILSGEIAALQAASKIAKQSGAKLIVPLKVSGPWHSRFMMSASEKMRDTLTVCPMRPPVFPVVSSLTGEFYQSVEQIRTCLVEQVLRPVRWVTTLERLIQEGHRVFVEVGPGRVLSGLMRDYGKDLKVMNVEKMDDLTKIGTMASSP